MMKLKWRCLLTSYIKDVLWLKNYHVIFSDTLYLSCNPPADRANHLHLPAHKICSKYDHDAATVRVDNNYSTLFTCCKDCLRISEQSRIWFPPKWSVVTNRLSSIIPSQSSFKLWEIQCPMLSLIFSIKRRLCHWLTGPVNFYNDIVIDRYDKQDNFSFFWKCWHIWQLRTEMLHNMTTIVNWGQRVRLDTGQHLQSLPCLLHASPPISITTSVP